MDHLNEREKSKKTKYIEQMKSAQKSISTQRLGIMGMFLEKFKNSRKFEKNLANPGKF